MAMDRSWLDKTLMPQEVVEDLEYAASVTEEVEFVDGKVIRINLADYSSVGWRRFAMNQFARQKLICCYLYQRQEGTLTEEKEHWLSNELFLP